MALSVAPHHRLSFSSHINAAPQQSRIAPRTPTLRRTRAPLSPPQAESPPKPRRERTRRPRRPRNSDPQPAPTPQPTQTTTPTQQPTQTTTPTPQPVAPTNPTPQPIQTTTPTPQTIEATTELGEVRLPVLGLEVQEAFPELKELREAFGPMLPADITYTDVDPADPALKGMVFFTNYDEGFCGHFSVPGKQDEGAAARFEDVMATSDPFRFIQDHLRATPNAGRADISSDELVIFTPGLRTFHYQTGSQETAPSRLQHYANTLGCALAQLHIGTDVDQGDVEIKITPAYRAILSGSPQQLSDAGLVPKEIKGDTAVFAKEQRDKLEAGLTVVGFTRPLWQTHLIELLKWNEGPRRPLVLMPYSRTAVELTTTLKAYISGYQGDQGEVEALLRETLTVVTIGNGTRPFGWPNGPAYVHVGGWSVDQQGPPAAPGSSPLRGTDPGLFYEGVHAGETERAGSDAVFVHSDWVWSTGEAHNFASAGAASLRLVMAMNNVTGFRELYNRLSAGEVLKKPSFEEVKAAVAVTGSQEFMWNKGRAPWEGVGDLPSVSEAEVLVGQWM